MLSKTCKWLAVCFSLFIALVSASASSSESSHTNNWAVIVDTSIFWFNYRHIANALSIYRAVKSMGIPDDQIILMLADDMACNNRNVLLGEMYNNQKKEVELYGTDIEVDYRGEEVTVENFLRVLTGRHLPGTPASKRLNTDDGSNILIYMTGHGGEEFLKFADSEEVGSLDLNDSFKQMWERKRYHEILFMIDTCQAYSMLNQFDAPNIASIGSSLTGENSYSHHNDRHLGVAVIDRFTYATLDFVQRHRQGGTISRVSLSQFFNSFQFSQLHSHVGFKSTLSRGLEQVRLVDFVGSTMKVRHDVREFAIQNDTYANSANGAKQSNGIEWSEWPEPTM